MLWLHFPSSCSMLSLILFLFFILLLPGFSSLFGLLETDCYCLLFSLSGMTSLKRRVFVESYVLCGHETGSDLPVFSDLIYMSHLHDTCPCYSTCSYFPQLLGITFMATGLLYDTLFLILPCSNAPPPGKKKTLSSWRLGQSFICPRSNKSFLVSCTQVFEHYLLT